MKAIAVRLFVAGLLLGVVLLGFWATRPGSLLAPQDFNFDAIDKFRFGMSEEEVDRMMCVPAGCYDGAVINKDDNLPWPKLHELNTQKTWVNRWVVVVIEFDRGKACGLKASGRSRPAGEPDPRKKRPWWEKLVD